MAVTCRLHLHKDSQCPMYQQGYTTICVFKLPPTSSAQCRRVWVCVQSASNWFRWFKQSMINTTDSARYDCMILSHSLMCLILLFLPNTTVPSPSVSISHDGGTESLYSGTSLTLTCVVTVSSMMQWTSLKWSWTQLGAKTALLYQLKPEL